MTDTNQGSCRCVTCPGAACACGCQKPATQQSCACGTQCMCGTACACFKG